MSGENPLVSIIIPCHNDGVYLKDSIESVKAQTYPNIELIVVDNGSTDPKTIRFLEALRSQGEKLYFCRGKGPACARNFGIERCTGKYICALDADDRIAPEYISSAISVLEANEKVGIVYSKAKLFGKAHGLWDLPPYSLERMLLDNVIFVTALFRKRDWISAGGYCEELDHGMEDYDFWLSLIEAGCEVFQIQEVLFFYRIKKASRTSQLWGNRDNAHQAYTLIYQRHQRLYQDNHEAFVGAIRLDWLVQNQRLNWIRHYDLFIKFVDSCTPIKRWAKHRMNQGRQRNRP